MYCSNCGNKLESNANFCTNCGTSINNISQDKVESNELLLNLKPKFNVLYHLFDKLMVFIIIILMTALPTLALGIESFIGVLAFEIVIFVIIMLIMLGFKSKQYKKISYEFYNTKGIFKDQFLNFIEKEVKYKHIREVTVRQTFFQRLFNLGTIYLYTNAESGFNGLSIIDIENVEDAYKKVKQIINI